MAPHLAFAIEDWEKTRAALERQGFEPVLSAQSGQLWIQDPDGYVIELIVPPSG